MFWLNCKRSNLDVMWWNNCKISQSINEKRNWKIVSSEEPCRDPHQMTINRQFNRRDAGTTTQGSQSDDEKE